MLPSDVARLVLVYLKDEGLSRSYKQFFNESPHLEELRRHPDIEPSVPYEKGLPEILSEYTKLINAIKDKINCNQVMASLWKIHNEVIGQLRFQYTGNAGLLQTQTQEQRTLDQRTLTRYRMTELRKQQELQRKLAIELTTTTTPNTAFNTTRNTGLIPNSVSVATSPIDVIPKSIRPPNQGHPPIDSSSLGLEVDIEVTDNEGRDRATPVIPEFRTPIKDRSMAGTQQLNTPVSKSPKRKSATPRRTAVPTPATNSSPHSADNFSSTQMEEDFPDLPQVLESLINNTEFQEKLAGNINKKLPVENQLQPVKETNNSTQDHSQSSTSIEELLNLHMSDNTVHEIVQSTSTDPAFESLFSLFNIEREQYHPENPEESSYQQPTFESLPSTEGRTSQSHNDIIMTSQSPTSVATPLTNQSHCLSNQDASHVTYSANQNSREIGSSTVITSSNTGQLISASIQPPVTSTPMGTQPGLHLTPSTTCTSSATQQTAEQVVTLPVFLNNSGQYQIMQSTGSSSQNLVVNAPVGFQGGTLFLTPDGRVLSSSNIAIQNDQQLQTNQFGQDLSIRQSGTQQVVPSIPSLTNECPVHGKKKGTTVLPSTPVQTIIASQGVSLNTSITPSLSSVSQSNGTQNLDIRGQNEVVQLLASMVDSDVGSLFTESPERSFSSTPPSSKHSSKGAGSKKKRAPSSEIGSETVGNINKYNSLLSQSSEPRQIMQSPTMMQSNQAVNGNRNMFSSISNMASNHVVISPGLTGTTLIPQVLSTPLEASVTTSKSPPGISSKPRKQIQFKGPVLSRTLDVGGTSEIQTRLRGGHQGSIHVNPDSQSSTTKTKSRGKSVRSNSSGQNKAKPQDPLPKTKATSKPAHQLAVHNKSAPSDVTAGTDDMSAEVNIAAQMLVCLSNSPPSLRQSPYRQQRLRNSSGHSPAKSPSRDWVMELRKEIGLTPKNRHLQEKEQTKQETSKQDSQKDAKSSKRKSRTPRKQANMATETVVMTLPSDTQQKSKTLAPTIVHTRAALQKAKSPGKISEDPAPTRKSSRSTKSSRKLDAVDGEDVGGVSEKGDNSMEGPGKKENRGQKRNRDANTKEETNKKSKTAKNTKKTKRSQSFPSNLDVDKFLSSLQYAE